MHVRAILDQKGRNVLTIRPDATLQDAVRVLHENRIGALVVIGVNEHIKGILSERDIVRAVASHGPRALEEPVSRFMTGQVVTCTGSSSINDLMELMTQQKFRHVPVVEGGRLAGFISIGDVV